MSDYRNYETTYLIEQWMEAKVQKRERKPFALPFRLERLADADLDGLAAEINRRIPKGATR